MVYKASRFSRGGYSRPSEDIDPKLKQSKPDYSLAMNRYIYAQFATGGCVTGYTDIDKIEFLRSYADGRQDPGIYKDIILGKETPSAVTSDETSDEWANIFRDREGLTDIDFTQIFSPAPKYMMNIQGMFDNADFDLEVQAIDEYSSNLREEIKYTDLIEGEYETFFSYVNAVMDLPQGPKKTLPKNAEELEMFQQMGSYKLAYEVAMGYALKYTSDISNDKKVKRRVIADLITCGRACVFVYSDSAGVIKYKYVDIADLVLENSREEDCSDSSFGGYIDYMTIADFRAENPDMPETEVLKYATQYSGQLGNNADYMRQYEDGTSSYDNFRIPVFNCWWKASDTEYTTKHVDGREFTEPYKKNGMRPPKMLDTPNRKTSKLSIRRLYRSKWVVDTDWVYDYGVCTDIPFDYHSKDVRLPFMYFKIPGKPIIEQMVPVLNNIQLTYLYLQNAIAKAPPPGLKIDIGSVENVSFGNKKVHPLSIIKIYQQTGNLLYRLAPTSFVPGQTLNQSPIDQLGSMLDSAIASGISSLERWFMEIDRITGISQNAVSSIDPSQGLGVSQINLATTSNTLKPIIIGWQSIKSVTGTYCANKIQSVIYSHKKSECPYYEILGSASYASIKSAGEYPPASWATFIKATIDTRTKEELLNAAKSALAVGKDGVPILSFSDYTFIVDKIENGGSVASIRAFIAYREQKAAEESFARAQASMQNQAQATMQINQQKAMAEQASAEAELKTEIIKIREKATADIAVKRAEHIFKMIEMGKMPQGAISSVGDVEEAEETEEVEQPEPQMMPQQQQTMGPNMAVPQ